MTSKDELKRAVCEAIDRHGNEIIELGETILHHPETGFNEGKTAAAVADKMRQIGLSPETGLALTGERPIWRILDRKSTRLNSSHVKKSYAVFCWKKKKSE